ncbi:MAG: hypothetical protein ACTSXD_08520 [Candidatus Heimdallarchaeaceae archaeon]
MDPRMLPGWKWKHDKHVSIGVPEMIRLYHNLMMTYGYIPYEDFLNMPASLLSMLISEISNDNEKIKQKVRKNV